MKRNLLLSILISFIIPLLCCMPLMPVSAQSSWDEREDASLTTEEANNDEETPGEESASSACGRVIGLDYASKNVTLTSEEGSGEYIYQVGEDTTFIGADSLDGISEGDYLGIDYHISGGERIADNIILEMKENRQEASSEQGHKTPQDLIDMGQGNSQATSK